MSVRAKFKVATIEAQQWAVNATPEHPAGVKEMRTIVLRPVYGNNDPNHENTKFWNASPSGEIRLGTINPEAWEQFALGAEMYIDFTPAA